MKKKYILFLLLNFIMLNLHAQCAQNNTSMSCNGGNGMVVDNANINTGNYYWWNSGVGTLNNINLNGGTLVICGGNLTINNINFNGGWIYIMGGTLTINNNLNMSGNISNYGNLIIQGNFVIQGNPSQVFNHNGASIQVSQQTTINNTSQLINSGLFNTNNLTIQTSTTPAICQNVGAIINVSNNFSNNTNNSVVSYGGNSCIYFGNNITLNQNLSSTSNLFVCDAPGGTQSGGGNFGSAVVQSNCSSCSFTLPVELVKFHAKFINNKILLEWETFSEVNNDYFEIEKSLDCIDFITIGSVGGSGFSNKPIKYNFIDYNYSSKGTIYYRLKQVDFDGKFSYSKIITVNIENINEDISYYPNPVTDNLIYINFANSNLDNFLITFYDINGKILSIDKKVISENLIEIRLNKIQKGVYVMNLYDKHLFNSINHKIIIY